jgi:hypothetical protein
MIQCICYIINIHNRPLSCRVCQLAYTSGQWAIVYANWNTQQLGQWMGCCVCRLAYTKGQWMGCCVCQLAYTTCQLYANGLLCMPIGIHNIPSIGLPGYCVCQLGYCVCKLAYTIAHWPGLLCMHIGLMCMPIGIHRSPLAWLLCMPQWDVVHVAMGCCVCPLVLSPVYANWHTR